MRLLRRSEPKFMHRATPFMDAAVTASRRLGHDYVATEHLLLALSEDRESVAARVLAGRGLLAGKVQAEILARVGGCESPRGRLDGDALATLGIDLDEVRRQVEHAFGLNALERTWAGCTPVAPRLKRALEIAARTAGDGPLRAEHVLLGLASVKDCVAAQILAVHGLAEAGLRAAFGGPPPTRP